MGYHFRNLVFEGGGVKGIAYVGALEVLQKKKILADVRRVGGTSAGAITATLVGLGYSVADINEILWELDFNKFLDDSWGVVRDTGRLINEFGWYRGDFFREWISERIADKTGSKHTTFRDLDHWIKEGRGFKHVYFLGTNLSTGYAEVFSHEHTPRWTIADAVRISMSIPLFFAARRSVRGDVYVDGGMLNNYPVKVFDRRKYVGDDHSLERDYYATHNKALDKQKGTKERGIAEYVYNQETLGFRPRSAPSATTPSRRATTWATSSTSPADSCARCSTPSRASTCTRTTGTAPSTSTRSTSGRPTSIYPTRRRRRWSRRERRAGRRTSSGSTTLRPTRSRGTSRPDALSPAGRMARVLRIPYHADRVEVVSCRPR
jgi:NTE family protein